LPTVTVWLVATLKALSLRLAQKYKKSTNFGVCTFLAINYTDCWQ